MDNDLILIIGVVLGVFSIPSMLSPIVEGRFPRLSLLIFIASACLIAWVYDFNIENFSIWDIPETFIRVIARIL